MSLRSVDTHSTYTFTVSKEKQKRTTSVISEKLTYLHPIEKEQHTVLNRLMYVLEDNGKKIVEYMPSISNRSYKQSLGKEKHFEHDFAHCLKVMEETKEAIYDILLQMKQEDDEGFEHFAREFFERSMEIYNSIKWQVYYVAGMRVEDLPYDAERKNILVDVYPGKREGLFHCPVSGVAGSEGDFDVHHMDKRALWGTSYRAVLIKLHRSFHELIHKVVDNPALEEKIQGMLQGGPRERKADLREKILTILPHIHEDTLHSVHGMFGMEYYIQSRKRTLQGRDKNHIDHFIEEHEESIPQMRDTYVLEMATRLLDEVPFFVENTRAIATELDSDYLHKGLLYAKSALEQCVLHIREARTTDFLLATTSEEVRRKLPKQESTWTKDILEYYRDEYVEQIYHTLKQLISIIVKLSKTKKHEEYFSFQHRSTLHDHLIHLSENESLQEWRELTAQIEKLFGYLECLSFSPPEETDAPIKKRSPDIFRKTIYQPLLLLQEQLFYKCARVEKPVKLKRK